jgi:hypothetical protein
LNCFWRFAEETELHLMFPDGNLYAGFGTMSSARILQLRNLRQSLSITCDIRKFFDLSPDQRSTSEMISVHGTNFSLSNPLIAQLLWKSQQIDIDISSRKWSSKRTVSWGRIWDPRMRSAREQWLTLSSQRTRSEVPKRVQFRI